MRRMCCPLSLHGHDDVERHPAELHDIAAVAVGDVAWFSKAFLTAVAATSSSTLHSYCKAREPNLNLADP
jgi:hypothetical protein